MQRKKHWNLTFGICVIMQEPTTPDPTIAITTPSLLPTAIHLWTCEEVFHHFHKLFPIQAHVFLDHYIDGFALLLMERSDVFELHLPIGVAIRMHDHIKRIQAFVKEGGIAEL